MFEDVIETQKIFSMGGNPYDIVDFGLLRKKRQQLKYR